MRKYACFADFIGLDWPLPSEMEHYFLSISGRRKAFGIDNDCWGLFAEGLDGTEHLPAGEGRIDVHLTMVGNPSHGVLLHYHKAGGGGSDIYYSREDSKRLRELVKNKHGHLMPIGLFIPFEQAWSAVREFIQTDGALPQGIAWIADDDIPPDAFPESPDSHSIAPYASLVTSATSLIAGLCLASSRQSTSLAMREERRSPSRRAPES